MNFINFFGSSGPTVYIAPSTIGHFWGLAITNSMLYGWISLLAMLVLFIWVAHRVSIRPRGGLTQFVEVAVEFITNTVESAFDDKTKARKYIPYYVTLFCFLLVNNWSGLLPFANEAFTAHGVPLLRPMTGDLNTTLAAAVVTMSIIYFSSIREAGSLKNYLQHFFVGNPLNPMYFVLGLLEMLSDITRVISLSLRLFLNIAIGEIIVIVFAYLGHLLAPFSSVAFYLIDGFDGALQAFIFTILSIMYLAIVVNMSQHSSQQPSAPENSDVTPAQLAHNGVSANV